MQFSQVMPKVEANSQVCCLLGNFALGCAFGDRRTLTLARSTEYKFAEDQLTLKATERVDFVAHDIGDTNATPADQVPGPIVGLITAAA